jgi:hypothetical protein
MPFSTKTIAIKGTWHIPNSASDFDVNLLVIVRPVDSLCAIKPVVVLGVADNPIEAGVLGATSADNFLSEGSAILQMACK